MHQTDTSGRLWAENKLETSGDTKADGKKRGAGTSLLRRTKRLLVADFDTPVASRAVPMGYSRALPLEGLIAPGDSGGGLFITTSTGTYLAGVNSFVGSDSGQPHSIFGNFSGHARFSAFSDWIEASIHGEHPIIVDPPEEESAGSKRMTVIPAPEPGSLVLLFVAAVMLGISRCLLRRPAVR